VPASDAEFAALGAGATSVSDISAAAVFDSAPGPDGAPAGARIVVNPSAFAKLSAVGRGIVLRHEITHVATARDTTLSSPRWLVEGIAEYVAYRDSSSPARTVAQELRAAVTSGGLPAALPSDSAFGAAGAQAAALYQESWLACRLIAERVGTAGLLSFYRAVGAGVGAGDAPVTTAMTAVLHESQATFVAQWRAYLQRELR
jgi:hypothetical protein